MGDQALTLDRALEDEDSYSGMLDVACLLADKAAHGTLSHQEQQIRLVTWVDCQVCNGGWEQWMWNTTARGISETLPALLAVGCTGVHDLAVRALRAVGLEAIPQSDEAKNAQLGKITDQTREILSQLDDLFYSPVEDYMAKCKTFIVAHRSGFGI